MHAHIHGHTCLRHTRTHTRSNATVVTGFCSSFPLAEFPFPLFSVPLVNISIVYFQACKKKKTNQCHSLCPLYWFVLCNLQIFSGCVCHLEQLHAQSPFLFPIIFSINLIPFFDIWSVLAVLSPGLFGYALLCAAVLGPLRGRNSCCLWFWQLVFGQIGVSLRDATSNLPSSPIPSLKQESAPRWEKA